MTYREQSLPIDIGKSNNKFKDGKPKYFNCKIYKHIAWDYKKSKKEKDTQKCYMWKSRIYCQGLQDKDEEEKYLRRKRYKQ